MVIIAIAIHDQTVEVVIDLSLQLIFHLFLHGVSHALLLGYFTHFWQGAHLELDSRADIVYVRGGTGQGHDRWPCYDRCTEGRLLYVYLPNLSMWWVHTRLANLLNDAVLVCGNCWRASLLAKGKMI